MICLRHWQEFLVCGLLLVAFGICLVFFLVDGLASKAANPPDEDGE